MSDEAFILRVVLSFVLGGSYIALITRVSELFGAKIGGVLSSTPTTALMGMIFLAVSESADSLVEAAPGIVIGISASMVMLTVYVFARRRLATNASLFVSMVCWAVTAVVARELEVQNLFIAGLFFGAFFAVTTLCLRHIREVKATKKPASISTLIMRMLFAGTVVSSVVIASRVAGPFWGGLAAGFPAMYISNLLILEREQGHAFTASVIKHLPMGSFSTVSFGISVGLFAKSYSSALSIAMAFVVSLIVASFVYVYKTKKEARSEAAQKRA